MKAGGCRVVDPLFGAARRTPGTHGASGMAASRWSEGVDTRACAGSEGEDQTRWEGAGLGVWSANQMNSRGCGRVVSAASPSRAWPGCKEPQEGAKLDQPEPETALCTAQSPRESSGERSEEQATMAHPEALGSWTGSCKRSVPAPILPLGHDRVSPPPFAAIPPLGRAPPP